jgi:hypothetical protein
MKITHEFPDHNALDVVIIRDDIIIKRLVDQTATIEDGTTQALQEIIMHTHQHTTVWGTHIGAGCAKDAKSWYQQIKEWWAVHKAARQEAKLAALNRYWDAKREAVISFRAETAREMAAAQHALAVARMLYGLRE